MRQAHAIAKDQEASPARSRFRDELTSLLLQPVAGLALEQLAQRMATEVQKRAEEVDEEILEAREPDHGRRLLLLILAILATIRFPGIPRLVERLWRASIAIAWGEVAPRGASPPLERIRGTLGPFEKEVAGIEGTLLEQLRRIIVDAWTADQTPAGFAARVRTAWNRYARSKAQGVAVTEWTRATGRAALFYFEQTGVERVVWVTVQDGDVCFTCQDNEDHGPVDLGDSFPSGDDAPPGHGHCRCRLAPA